MSELEIVFWSAFAVAAYALLGYPMLLALAGTVWRRPRRIAPVQTSVSMILAVHNEEKNLPRRLDELSGLLQAAALKGEIIVVSDGSTDRSADVARQFADRGVRVVTLEHNQGKAAALSRAFAEARHDVVVFADAGIGEVFEQAKHGSVGPALARVGEDDHVMACLGKRA